MGEEEQKIVSLRFGGKNIPSIIRGDRLIEVFAINSLASLDGISVLEERVTNVEAHRACVTIIYSGNKADVIGAVL